MKYLLEKGCHAHCRYKGSGATLFHAACAHGELDIVKYPITEQNCNTGALDSSGDTGLHYAAIAGHFDIV